MQARALTRSNAGTKHVLAFNRCQRSCGFLFGIRNLADQLPRPKGICPAAVGRVALYGAEQEMTWPENRMGKLHVNRINNSFSGFQTDYVDYNSS